MVDVEIILLGVVLRCYLTVLPVLMVISHGGAVAQTGGCPSEPTQEALQKYQRCADGMALGKSRKALIVDADRKMAWIIDAQSAGSGATPAAGKCYTLAIGSKSGGALPGEAVFGNTTPDQESKLTPSGFHLTASRKSSRKFKQGYIAMKGLDSDNSLSYERGIYLHALGNTTETEGCLGFKNSDWNDVKRALKSSGLGSPVFIWGKAMGDRSGCDNLPGKDGEAVRANDSPPEESGGQSTIETPLSETTEE